VDLESVAAALGGEVVESEAGQAILVEQVHAIPPARPGDGIARLGLDPDATAGGLCFLDTETTGLSSGAGNQVFLIAMAWRRAEALVVRQYILADPGHEAAFLDAACADISASGALVTYNGRSFDVPVLQTRLVMTRRPPIPDDKPHLDLLWPVRRAYRPRLGVCTLGNVEMMVLGRDRGEDVPGYLIPELYFKFLRRRDPDMLHAILAHNRQDVVTLSLLLDRLLDDLDEPVACHPLDRIGLARLLEAAGDVAGALHVYERTWLEADDAWDGEIWPGDWTAVEVAYIAGLRLALLRRRAGEHDAAQRVLAELWQRHPAPFEAGIMLAKHLEHRRKDVTGALDVVAAAADALEEMPGRTVREDRWLGDLRRRRLRLERKVAKVADAA